MKNTMNNTHAEERYSEEYDESYKNPHVLYKLYWMNGNSIPDIADILECHPSTIHGWMVKHDIDRRRAKQDKYPSPRTESPNSSRKGYEVIHCSHDGKTEQFSHHRLLAVAEYGIDEVEGSDVHHINEIPWDNRPDNLELMSHGEHSSYHRLNEREDALWRNESVMREMYVDEKMPMPEIAEKLDCSTSTVDNWLKKHDIPTRSTGYPSQRENLNGRDV